jgi:hypothetical protein
MVRNAQFARFLLSRVESAIAADASVALNKLPRFRMQGACIASFMMPASREKQLPELRMNNLSREREAVRSNLEQTGDSDELNGVLSPSFFSLRAGACWKGRETLFLRFETSS